MTIKLPVPEILIPIQVPVPEIARAVNPPVPEKVTPIKLTVLIIENKVVQPGSYIMTLPFSTEEDLTKHASYWTNFGGVKPDEYHRIELHMLRMDYLNKYHQSSGTYKSVDFINQFLAHNASQERRCKRMHEIIGHDTIFNKLHNFFLPISPEAKFLKIIRDKAKAQPITAAVVDENEVDHTRIKKR